MRMICLSGIRRNNPGDEWAVAPVVGATPSTAIADSSEHVAEIQLNYISTCKNQDACSIIATRIHIFEGGGNEKHIHVVAAALDLRSVNGKKDK